MGALILATLALSAVPASPEELVRRLGSPRYAEREEAARLLLSHPSDARVALRAALSSPDAEVRHRAAVLLPRVSAASLPLRLEAFWRDPASVRPEDVPGWARFRKEVGTDPDATRLFQQMVREYADLFEAADSKAAELNFMAEQRFIKLSQGKPGSPPRPMGPADVAALMFATAELNENGTDQAVNRASSMLHQPAFAAALTGPQAAPFRRLFAYWADRRPINSVFLSACLVRMLLADMPEALPLARRVLSKRAPQGHTRAQAALALGRFGGPAATPELETLLGDNGMASMAMFETQVRDVALNILVRRAGESPKDYGFALPEADPARGVGHQQLGFRTMEEREAAIKKWKARPVAGPKK